MTELHRHSPFPNIATDHLPGGVAPSRHGLARRTYLVAKRDRLDRENAQRRRADAKAMAALVPSYLTRLPSLLSGIAQAARARLIAARP